MCHSNAVRFHGVTLPIVVITNVPCTQNYETTVFNNNNNNKKTSFIFPSYEVLTSSVISSYFHFRTLPILKHSSYKAGVS